MHNQNRIERNWINSFTRGGQFLNHFVKMAKDNLLRYLLLGSLVAGGFGYFKFKANADDHDRYVVVQETVFNALTLVNPKMEKQVALQRADGSSTLIDIKSRHTEAQWAADVERAFALLWGALRYGAFLGLSLVLMIILLAWYIGKAFATDKRLRGASLESVRKVRSEIDSYNRKERRRQSIGDYHSYTIAGVEFPLRAETQHLALIGSTGSGKTQQLAKLIAQIRAKGDRGILYDKMRSFVPRFHNPDTDLILNPLDLRCANWDIFADARSLVDWEDIARAILPESREGDAFFTTTARTVFAHTANIYARRCREADKTPTIHGLLSILTQTSHKQLSFYLAGSIAAGLIDATNERTTGSIRATIADGIRSLGYLKDAAPGESTVSLRRWIADESHSGFIFMTSREDMHPVLQPLITMWITILNSALMSQERSDRRLVWFLLDELPSLNRVPGIENALAEARQYGAAYVVGLQLVSQLRDKYGRDTADTIMGLTRNKVVFNPGDNATAKVMSEAIGQTEILQRQHGISIGANTIRDGQSVNTQVTMRPIILPEDLTRLEPLNGILSMTGDFSACRFKIKWESLDGKTPRYVEDPEANHRAEDLNPRPDLSHAAAGSGAPAMPTPTDGCGEAPAGMADALAYEGGADLFDDDWNPIRPGAQDSTQPRTDIGPGSEPIAQVESVSSMDCPDVSPCEEDRATIGGPPVMQALVDLAGIIEAGQDTGLEDAFDVASLEPSSGGHRPSAPSRTASMRPSSGVIHPALQAAE